MTQEPLSTRQRQALDYICRHYAAHGYLPSLAEVAAGIGVARSTAQAHVDALQVKGYLAQEPGKARAAVPLGMARPDAEECVAFAQDYSRHARCVTAEPWRSLAKQALRALGRLRR